MGRGIWWAFLVFVWVITGLVLYYWWKQQGEGETRESPPVATQPAPQATEPGIRYPIEKAQPQAQEGEAPLPPLNEGDQAVEDSLAAAIGRDSVAAFLNTTGFIRRVVATVDNLPRKKAPQRLWFVKPTAGRFVTTGESDNARLSPDNYRRYTPFVRLVEAADTGKVVALYVRFYPLFQQAYMELGHPKGYFNDRLVEVIDHLLATPDVAEPIKLAHPWVMYEFADPELEALSAGQKILIRIGSENAARLKAKLRDIRRLVAARPMAQ